MATAPAAFQATVHGFRTVPTRKVVQVTIEAPIEQHAHIAAVAEHGAWVAVARLQEAARETAPAAKRETTLPQRVAMTCQEPAFKKFWAERYGCDIDLIDDNEVAFQVRHFCGVQSRSEILPGTEAAKRWDELHARYLGWQRGM